MGKKLVIVESPAKAKTINKILGAEFVVSSSVGHIRDLPVKTLGVDVEHGFAPQYVLMPGKKKVIDQLKQLAKSCDAVYLAPDPDREGEAIAWHIEQVLKPVNPATPFFRVQYNEITPAAVRKAFEHPGEINLSRVDAQQARRILDRLVGYTVSPMLWRRIQRGLSAGRVQSVALRLVCEREEQIRSFQPQPFWIIGAKVRKRADPRDPFLIRLVRIDDQKADVRAEEQAGHIRADLEGRALRVSDIATREVSRRPFPPFTTSTLQQSASGALGLSPKRTMSIAQRLYEGVDLGEGPVGLITYMRTDSVSVAAEAAQDCRRLIVETFGPAYCPEAPNVYRSRTGAQEAHEAIRPTDVRRAPQSLVDRLDPVQLRLYRLIWERFVASQMTPARIEQRNVKVAVLPPPGSPSAYLFQATASEVKFPGFMQVAGAFLPEKKEEGDDAEEAQAVPPLAVGEELECLQWLSDRKETKPPPRYSEATLVRALEGNGIGRPSTYAQILSTLQDRKYVLTEKRSLVPTDLGVQVNQLLVARLDALFNVRFTASMEATLDEVENGAVQWTSMLADFYRQLQGWMQQMPEVAVETAAARRLLAALESVQEWGPEVKRGKRTLSDRRFVESIRKQVNAGKELSVRQLAALVRIAAKYREQVPAIEVALRESGHEQLLMRPEPGPPDEETLRRLAAVRDLDLDDYGRKLVDSLANRVAGGRGLTPAQCAVLGRVVLRHAGQIADFESLRGGLGLEAAPSHADDPESRELLDALKSVKEWKLPVRRGRMVFDDKAFFASLSQQFARKHFLTDRQRAALKKMVGRYQAQVEGFAALAEKFGVGRKDAAPPASASADAGALEV
jgi:DNA topoisomerase-1